MHNNPTNENQRHFIESTVLKQPTDKKYNILSSNIFLERGFYKTHLFTNSFYKNSKCNQQINDNEILVYGKTNDKIKNIYNELRKVTDKKFFKQLLIDLLEKYKLTTTDKINYAFKKIFFSLYGDCININTIKNILIDHAEYKMHEEYQNYIKYLDIVDIPFILYFINDIDAIKISINMLPFFYDAYEKLTKALANCYFKDNFSIENTFNIKLTYKIEKKYNKNKYKISPYTFLSNLYFKNELCFCIFHILLFTENTIYEYNIIQYCNYLHKYLKNINKTSTNNILNLLNSSNDKTNNKTNENILNNNKNIEYLKSKMNYYKIGEFTTENNKKQISEIMTNSPLNSSFILTSTSSNLSSIQEQTFISENIIEEPEKLEMCICSYIINLLGTSLAILNLNNKATIFYKYNNICQNTYNYNLSNIFFMFEKVDNFFYSENKIGLLKIISELESIKDNKNNFIKENILAEYIFLTKMSLNQLSNTEDKNIDILTEIINLGLNLTTTDSFGRWVFLLIYELINLPKNIDKNKYKSLIEKVFKIYEKLEYQKYIDYNTEEIENIEYDENFIHKIQNPNFYYGLYLISDKLESDEIYLRKSLELRSYQRKIIRKSVNTVYLNNTIYNKKLNKLNNKLKNKTKILENKNTKQFKNSFYDFDFTDIKLGKPDRLFIIGTKYGYNKIKADQLLLNGEIFHAYYYYKKIKYYSVRKIVKSLKKEKNKEK